jgi:hypothetical protein
MARTVTITNTTASATANNSMILLSRPIAATRQSLNNGNNEVQSLSQSERNTIRHILAPVPPALQPTSHSNQEGTTSLRNYTREPLNSNSLHSFPVARRLETHPFDALASRLGYAVDGIGSTVSNPFSYAFPTRFVDPLQKKHVYELACLHCKTKVCSRAMRAILLADVKIELFSTDTPPNTICLIFEDYVTNNCSCKIRDVACTGCGNCIGYHVTQPCFKCLEARNNGHFWMFYAENVSSAYRIDPSSKQALSWGTIDQWESEWNKKILLQKQATLEEHHR